MNEPLLDIRGLEIGFSGMQAVNSASLTIEPGEWMALVGESGSGKSLTAFSVLGLLPEGAKAGGSIRFRGEELLNAPEPWLRHLRGKSVSMIFQEPMAALNPLHRIGRLLAEAITTHQRIAPAALKTRIAELLDQVGLSYLQDRLDAYPHQLSGGERQRVMIAMAIANNPELLIADEPTTAVDVTVQRTILELLKKLQREAGMALLFITHDLLLVRRLADRVAVMETGKIVECRKTAELFHAPQHPYTQRLLAAAPKGTARPLTGSVPETLSAEHLSVHFPIKGGMWRRTVSVMRAVDNATLAIREGETLGLVGESGSGKTTLGFALLRLLPSEGKIVFLGKDITALKSSGLKHLRHRMQLVFQDPYASLNPRMRVQEIIEEGLRVHNPELSAAERRKQVENALVEVGLSPEMKERYPHAFSGGQRQRINIARAMILKPRLIVLDEPTSALDSSVQAQVVTLLRELQSMHSISYLFISHDLRVVRAVAHRIAVMKHGKLVEQGETETLFSAPRDEYTRRLISAAMLEE